MQSVVDSYCSIGFAKVYLSKLPIAAIDILNDRVLPFYEQKGVIVDKSIAFSPIMGGNITRYFSSGFSSINDRYFSVFLYSLGLFTLKRINLSFS